MPSAGTIQIGMVTIHHDHVTYPTTFATKRISVNAIRAYAVVSIRSTVFDPDLLTYVRQSGPHGLHEPTNYQPVQTAHVVHPVFWHRLPSTHNG